MASDGEISCTNDPNFAVIYSFLKVFGKLYSLEVPTIAKLQELIENTQEVLDPLRELHLRLLRRALKSVQSNRWERCLIKFCHQQAHHQEAWEIERFSYKKASVQVKLKILKILLEYQFTCHPKFKTAVNAISCKDLRLDPIGRDKNGCVYWLQVDHDANLCLYKEDQDEETWQLIASNRDELVKIINQLKSGEEVSASVACSVNEDSSGADVPPTTEPNKSSDIEEENEEEFLSPESESEHESDEQKEQKDSDDSQKNNTEIIDESADKEDNVDIEDTVEENTTKETSVLEENIIEKVEDTENIKEVENKDEEKDIDTSETLEIKSQQENSNLDVNKCNKDNISDIKPPENEKSVCKDEDAVGEAIEEPVMIVTGEGNGADCESSYIIGEEICEPVMYFYGEGWGYENDTGNPEVEKEQTKENSDGDNPDEECNGEHNDISISNSKSRLSKNVKLKSSPSVNKRSLKKQSNDSSDINKSDSKKHCIRDVDKSNGSNSNDKSSDNSLKRDSSVNDKSVTDSDKMSNNSIKKGRGKVKKKSILRKLKNDESNEVLNSVADTDNCQNNKASIIEKRKSSVSSDQDDVNNAENDKEERKSPAKEFNTDEALPPKKLRLESTPESDISESHSKETVDPLGDIECSGNDNIENKDLNSEAKNDSVSSRKKIKAVKGKLKLKKLMRNTKDNAKSNDEADADDKKSSKSLKRSLLNASLNDKNKSESQSESEEDLPITSGKRLKTKPKKIITSSRKKVEAKLLEKCSSESEEETLYSIAGKKSSKKMMKRKPKGRDREKDRRKEKEKERDKESDSETPVRQSRRIAQMKIREEAERRHLEEVALRELKMIHTKKAKDDEEEWRASGSSSESGGRKRARKPATWRACDSTGPDADSDSDEPLFEHEEPDLEFGKSDHEFSPESDLEDGEPSEPLKRARTLQEDKEEGGACLKCGSGEQPEWILLCDGCDGGYHASCLKPVLLLVPEGDWYCPPCNHERLISALEAELVKYDVLLASVQEERARRPPSEPRDVERAADHTDSSEASSGWSSSSSSGAVYRLRARRQLPVSYRSQEYDRLISSAIKEEYVEPTTSAGNQGRGKDISTIIEAAEEEKMKAEREAIEQGKPVELKKSKKKQRRKPRKLNSLEVPSEDDDETDEDFKDTGLESTSEDISSSAERDDTDSRSSDSLPIRRTCRPEKKGKDRPKLAESSPEAKKKKKVFEDSSSESAGTMEWSKKKSSSKPKYKSSKREKRDKSKRDKPRKRSGLTQYDADGNVIRARVTYGGLSDDDANDWSPKHRTRQKKINYTEMPNTESEDEMHKSSGKHMPDSSDEFKVDSEDSSEWESDRAKRRRELDDQSGEEKRRAISDLITKTAVVPLQKLPEDVTRAKTEELQAHLEAQSQSQSQPPLQPQDVPAGPPRPARGRGSRGGRGARGPRGGRGGRSGGPPADDALAKLVGVKIKELRPEGSSGPGRPNQAEREKKRQEREAKQAEKEARKLERLQKREEKEKAKELKAKEREEKKLARLAMQESKRMKREKDMGPGFMMGQVRPLPPERLGYGPPPRHPPDYQEQRFPATPRLQVRAELRGIASAEDRIPLHRPDQPGMREGTLSVAGSPQPFKPITEEPSIITRMPHMINQQYRGPMMYPGGNSGYGARGQGVQMYQMHPGLPPGARPQYAQYYPHLRPPPYPRHPSPAPPSSPQHGPHRPASSPHGPPASSPSPHGPSGPPGMPHGPPGMPHGPPGMPPHASMQHRLPGSAPHVIRLPPGASAPPGLGHPSPGPPGLGHPSSGPPGLGHPSPGPPGLGHPSPGPPGLSHPGSGPPGLGHPNSGAPGLSHPNSGPLGHMGPSAAGLHGHPGPGPPGHLGPGPPGHPGPPGIHAGPPSSPHGTPGHPGAPGPHGPPSSPHGPHLGPVNMHVGPPASPHGPPGMSPHHPQGMPPRPPVSSPHGGSQQRGPSPGLLPGPRVAPPPSRGPPALQSPLRPGSPAARDVKIKAEVKTEPEYRSPPASPGQQRPPSPEPPRHPKIKHTENKDRRPRYPLGPYAPQYGPYGPYAPPEQPPPRPPPPAPFAYLRSPFAGVLRPGGGSPGPYAEARGSPEARVKEEGGVFGGLVSYFSSQREDDLDA